MEIKAANDQTDPAKKPTAAEWAEVFAILTPARKIKHEYPAWVLQESDGRSRLLESTQSQTPALARQP